MSKHELLERHFDIALETPDGIKKLRELILSLAMKGKLVPQNPNDQPASELLKELEAERLVSITEGKIRKQEQMQFIQQIEIPYEIPDNWKWVRLGDVGETNIGLTYSPKDVSDIGTPVLRSNNIQKGSLDLSNLLRVDKEVKANVLVSEGDLLICARNGSKSLVGKTAQISGLYEKMAFGAFMAIFRSRLNNYILYFINSPLFRKMLDDVNTTTINQITQHNLKTTIVPLPPLPEQKRIVAKIDQLMALCDKLEAERNERDKSKIKIHSTAMNRLLSAPDSSAFNSSWSFITKHFSELYSVTQNVDELKKAILQLAVMGKLVKQDVNDQPAGELLKEIEAEKQRLMKDGKIKKQEALQAIKAEEIPYELPNGWAWVRLGDVGETNIGLTYSPKDISDIGIPVLRSNNIQKGKLDLSNLVRVNKEIKNNILVEEGDLLICARNGSKSLVGKTAQINSLHEKMAFGAFMAIFRSRLNDYVLYFINSPLFRQMIDEVGTTTINQITQGNLKSTIFPLPPLAEQKRIVEKINQLMDICHFLEQQIKDSTEKKSDVLEAVLARV